MLAPRDLLLGKIQDTSVLMRMNTIPPNAGIYFLLVLISRARNPRYWLLTHLVRAAIWFGIFQVAYILHSTGHILSAKAVGARMDSVLLSHGFQLNVYNNNYVSIPQHLGRASGGVIISSAALLSGYSLWSLLRRIPLLGGLAEAWFAANLVVWLGAIAPSPHFDGGSILKWGVTAITNEEALGEEALQQAGFVTVGVLLLAGFWYILRGKWIAGLGCWSLGGFMVADLLVLRGK